jgi:hypothetical protein
MMGRETNFRYSDLSSAFRNVNFWTYAKRLFLKGDEDIPERIKKEKPILHFTTHNLLAYAEPVFEGLGSRAIFIVVVRHPLYMIIQQTLNMERLLSTPRDVDVYFEYGDAQLPYYIYGWEKLYLQSNFVERAIYNIEKMTKRAENMRDICREKYNHQVVIVPFERFVIDPWPYMNRIAIALETVITEKTKKIMKKQRVPRKKISAGIPLNIYKRCGWEPPEKRLNEQQELDKRRQYAIEQGASKEAMIALDRICQEYEERCLSSVSGLKGSAM